MSDRERWIVYPLLLLSIGLSVTTRAALDEDHGNKKPADFNVIKCKALEVLGTDGTLRWALGTTAAGEGVLELTTSDGTRAAQLMANPSGALLSLFNRTGEIALRLGHENQQLVLVVTDRSNTPRFVIPFYPTQPQPVPQRIGPEAPITPDSSEKTPPDQKSSTKPSDSDQK